MISEVLRDNLLLLATTYAKAENTTLGMVSQRFYGNPDFFKDFGKRKRSVSVKKLDSMLVDFSEAWPDDKVAWPTLKSVQIERPKRKKRIAS